MTPYPHPAVNLAIFQQRLSTDIGATNLTYTLQCDAPVPTDSGLYDPNCEGLSAQYNSMVDMVVSGDLIGEVDQYLYNRLDLSQLQLPAKTFWPYLKASNQTVADLLPQINARSGLQLQVEDVVAYVLPAASGCECDCGPIEVPLEATSTSLLYIGEFPLAVIAKALRLQDALQQIFMPTWQLPAVA
jgi:hypothetical protein